MNLRDIANRVTSRVNPNTTAQWLAYAGYTVLANGKPSVTYASPVAIQIQAQAITVADLQHIDAMSLGTVDRVILTDAPVKAIDRASQAGGDLLVFESATWLVSGVLEDWSTSGWSRVTLTKQVST